MKNGFLWNGKTVISKLSSRKIVTQVTCRKTGTKSVSYPRVIIKQYYIKVNKLTAFVTKYCYFIETER